jgi:hypothetical protein
LTDFCTLDSEINYGRNAAVESGIMEEYTWARCEPDDPRRCQTVIATKGQCINLAVDGAQYCPVHSGYGQVRAEENKTLRTYRLKKYQNRLTEFAEHDRIKSLRDEIGILRILIEERLNLCHTDLDLMLHSSVLSDLIMKVEKVVTSCNRLENQLGLLLDKTQALQLGAEIVEIVARHVENEEVLQQIADEIISSISSR